MNLKQVLCLAIAAGVNVLISLIFIAGLKIPMEITSWFMIHPFQSFHLAGLKRNGLTFDIYLKQFFKYHVAPGTRKRSQRKK